MPSSRIMPINHQECAPCLARHISVPMQTAAKMTALRRHHAYLEGIPFYPACHTTFMSMIVVLLTFINKRLYN